jgi:hypothetical protein
MEVKLSEAHNNILQALITRNEAGNLHGAFTGIPIEVYHHPLCPGISSTRIKEIAATSFKHAVNKKFESTPEMVFGNAFHAWMESQDVFYARYTVGQHDFTGGKIFISYEELGRIKVMADNVRNHPVVSKILPNAKQEWTFFSRCPVTGILRKCRPDLFESNSIYDFKSTFDASAKVFGYMAKKLLYRIQAMYYLDVARDATGQPFDEFKFIAVESEGINEVALYTVHELSLITAKNEINNALQAIANSQQGGWTGYPLQNEPLLI